jgi:CTD nuclear envelope phosphatase 1
MSQPYDRKIIDMQNIHNIKKLNLILDLDETLIHSISRTKYRFNKQFKLSDAHITDLFLGHLITKDFKRVVFHRPYLFEFLENISKEYNIFVYTNGTETYAKMIIDMITSKLNFNPFLKYCCRANKKTQQMKKFVKDFSPDITENNTIIIDDCNVWPENIKNQIMIKKFQWPNELNHKDDENLNIMVKILYKINTLHNENKRKKISTHIKNSMKEFL